mgnify:CR=1 FL=1
MEYINKDVRRQDRLLDEARAREIIATAEYGIDGGRDRHALRHSSQFCLGRE